MIDPVTLIAVADATLRLATPLGFAALGGVLSERAGLYNIGLEGMILAGAFGAAAAAFATGSALAGLVGGVVCGFASGLILGLLAIAFRVNQLIAGIAVNLALAGLTAFLSRVVFGERAGATRVEGFDAVLLGQDPLVLGLFACAGGLWLWMFRTDAGLGLRAVGENPRAADVAGLPVARIRYAAIAVSGGLAALGGCHLVLAQVYLFSEGMSAGRGFIALAAVILGRWSPTGALAAALLFGLCDATQLRLQFANPEVPYQAFLILPYAAALVALVIFAGKVRPPSAVGQVYEREAR